MRPRYPSAPTRRRLAAAAGVLFASVATGFAQFEGTHFLLPPQENSYAVAMAGDVPRDYVVAADYDRPDGARRLDVLLTRGGEGRRVADLHYVDSLQRFLGVLRLTQRTDGGYSALALVEQVREADTLAPLELALILADDQLPSRDAAHVHLTASEYLRDARVLPDGRVLTLANVTPAVGEPPHVSELTLYDAQLRRQWAFRVGYATRHIAAYAPTSALPACGATRSRLRQVASALT